MQNTANLVDKIILFFCCSALYFFQADVVINVTPLLAVVIISSFLSYFDENRIKGGLIIGFIGLSVFMPGLAFFLPLLAYDVLYYQYWHISLLAILPFFNVFKSLSLQTTAMVLATLFLSLLVRYRMETQLKIQRKYKDLNDTTREMSIILKKQNRDLVEKQDNELNMATLNERNRIAREIHDNVGHLLSSAILQSGALMTINQDEKVKDHLINLNDTLSQAMSSIRNSVHNLYDESIDLNAQAKELVKQFNFCEISYDYQISSNPPKNLKYAFISIMKEALSNIMNHSNATQASVTFREHPALYQLIIRDNGAISGYSMDNGLGLKNMIDRVHSFEGNINIMADRGFEIFISIPKEVKKA